MCFLLVRNPSNKFGPSEAFKLVFCCFWWYFFVILTGNSGNILYGACTHQHRSAAAGMFFCGKQMRWFKSLGILAHRNSEWNLEPKYLAFRRCIISQGDWILREYDKCDIMIAKMMMMMMMMMMMTMTMMIMMMMTF